ncbi:hypothetical protein FACS189498_0040 [Spirochaetia bacterium]|nr:hypothetical protein [Reyranella sp.]GHV24014.1 hypothetical protein FACS189498_0040 [Spirochaetia bacterium]
MKHLLIVGGVAGALCLGLVAAFADSKASTSSVRYSRPTTGELLAQAQFSTLCRQNCQQTFAACHKQNPNDPSCSANYNSCIQECH